MKGARLVQYTPLIPAKAGIQTKSEYYCPWTPAFAGVSGLEITGLLLCLSTVMAGLVPAIHEAAQQVQTYVRLSFAGASS